MWLIIFMTITIGIFFLFIALDLKAILKDLKESTRKNSKAIDNISKTRKKNILKKFISETEKRIQSSNLMLYIPYNSFIHIILCIFLATSVFLFSNKHLNYLVSIIASGIGFMIPYVLLQLISEFMDVKVKKYSVDFLIILKNYFKASGEDIFKAFEKGKDSFVEPLRTHGDILVYEYRNKVNPVKALDNFSKKLPTRELSSFIENLKICYLYGGDTEGLIDGYIADISEINDDSDKEDLEDNVLNKGLYILLGINFYFIYHMLSGEYRHYLANTLWGTVVLSIDLVVSIYVIYNILRKEV